MENKKSFSFRFVPFLLLAMVVIGYGWWRYEHSKHCLLDGGWHKPTSVATWTAVPEFRWVTLENEVEHSNGEFNAGDTCSIDWGGEVQVVAESGTHVRLAYHTDWAAGAALCPDGARFLVERGDFATWAARSVERQQKEDEELEFVKTHRRRPRETDPKLDVFAWKWVDVVDVTMVEGFNPHNALTRTDRCGIMNGGSLFTIAERGADRLVYYQSPTDFPGGTACPTGTLFFYKGDET